MGLSSTRQPRSMSIWESAGVLRFDITAPCQPGFDVLPRLDHVDFRKQLLRREG
jgi:hypothetical protein